MKNALGFAVLAVAAIGLFAVLHSDPAQAAGGPGPSSSTVHHNENIQFDGTVTHAGSVSNTGTSTLKTTNINGPLYVDGGLTIGLANVAQKAVVGHTIDDGGTPAMAIETKTARLASGTLAWTFAQAFSYPPVCVCSDNMADAGKACNTGPSTISGTVVSGDTTALCNCICVGAR